MGARAPSGVLALSAEVFTREENMRGHPGPLEAIDTIELPTDETWRSGCGHVSEKSTITDRLSLVFPVDREGCLFPTFGFPHRESINPPHVSWNQIATII